MHVSVTYTGKEIQPALNSETIIGNLYTKLPQHVQQTVWDIPGSRDTGAMQRIKIREGLYLFMINYRPEDTLVLNFDHPRPVFGFGYCLSGLTTGAADGDPFRNIAAGGQSRVFYYTAGSGRTEDVAGYSRTAISVIMEPRVLLSILGNHCSECVNTFRQVADGMKTTEIDREEEGLTLPMSAVLNDLFCSRLHGEQKIRFLESKIIELISLRLHGLANKEITKRNQLFSATDIQRIEDASNLIRCNLETPPTLFELAARVGMPHSKLNRGFRQVFNSTVFGFLRRERLEKAKQLMEEQNKNVTEAALSVGYNSLSSFSKAFFCQFGMNPNACLGRNR